MLQILSMTREPSAASIEKSEQSLKQLLQRKDLGFFQVCEDQNCGRNPKRVEKQSVKTSIILR